MILGIDASSIRAGGGVVHLAELLAAAEPAVHGFEAVVLWAGRSTLDAIPERPWLRKCADPALEGGLLRRAWWQRTRLAGLAAAEGCAVLFVPGGSDASGFRPLVAMSQNLLPFEWREFRRFGLSSTTLKNAALRFAQARTFRRAEAVVFLTGYAREAVLRVTGPLPGATPVIPHGLHPRFSLPLRPARATEAFTPEDPCRILYVSIVDVYKHPWHVADAVVRLRARGLAVTLDLVGPPAAGARRLQRALRRLDPDGSTVVWHGAQPHESLPDRYSRADLCVFASSCETFGQILVEAMAAGLPIACSERSALPEVLGDAGAYFDPEDPESIAAAIERLYRSAELRSELAGRAHQRSRRYRWPDCARETFALLARVAADHRRGSIPIQDDTRPGSS